MKTLDLNVPFNPGPKGVNADVILDEGRAKVRRIDLAAFATSLLSGVFDGPQKVERP